MSVTQHLAGLLRLRANIDQQIADAMALIAELPECSQEAEVACFWLLESKEAGERIDNLIKALDGD